MINDETKKYVDKINTFINAGENNKYFDNNNNENNYDKNNLNNNNVHNSDKEKDEKDETNDAENSNNEKNNIINMNGIIDIFSVVPKSRLLKITENSILCNSKLEKIIKIPEKKKIVYSERFCVLTKKNFSYYKSKECFLKLTKPLLSINLKNVTRVEQDKLDDTSYYFGLICAINEDTKNYLDKINTYISVEDNNSEVFLLGFRSNNKDLIIKWIVILNYLIQNYK